MFLSPYDTTYGSSFNRKKLIHALEIANVEERLIEGILVTFPQMKAVLKDKEIIPFVHPVVQTFRKGEAPTAVIDLRSFTQEIRRLPEEAGYALGANGAIHTLIKRAQLQYFWETGQSRRLAGLSDLPLQVYANWIGGAIAKRGLDPAGQMVVVVLAAYFYLCLCTDDSEDLDNFPALCLRINKATHVPTAVILSTLQAVNHKRFVGIKDFCEYIATAGISRILDSFNAGVLLSSIIGSWFGSASAREIVAIAVEYPPTWIALVDAAINQRQYKKTAIGDIVWRYQKGNTFAQFTLAVKSLIAELESDTPVRVSLGG